MYSKFSFSLLDLIYRVLIKPKNNNNNKFDIDFSLRVLTYQKRQNFTCSGAQNHATENRGIAGVIVTSFQDIPFRNKQKTLFEHVVRVLFSVF